jgi:GDPmannose 4,6-dehydratase
LSQGLEDCLYLGNLNALRDWGHAKDYVRMQWMMLQQENPKDYVIATGVQYSIRDFIEMAAQELGIVMRWKGVGVDEIGLVDRCSPAIADGDFLLEPDQVIVRVDPRYFRPTEVQTLLGDPSLAKNEIGWAPQITVGEMVEEMVSHDLNEARRHSLLKQNGFHVAVCRES